MLAKWRQAAIALILVGRVAIGSETGPEERIVPPEGLIEQLSSEDFRERAEVGPDPRT